MRWIRIAGHDWDVDRVAVPDTFSERLRGMRRLPAPAMLFRASSVHGIGMSVPLKLVVLDRHGAVITVSDLPPGRVRWFRGARWIVEMTEPHHPPAVGVRARFYPAVHDGTSGGLRHTDRESGGRVRAPRRHSRRG